MSRPDLAFSRWKFERFVTKRWYSKSPGLLWLLFPLELLYRIVIARKLERPRISALDPPLVVVGNITAGGTGKTPFVIALIEALQAKGMKVGVISRGYGRTTRGLRLLSWESTADQVGDEPLLIHERTHVPVCVANDRMAAYEAIKASVDLVVADDGLQNRHLHRSYEIALIDSNKGFGNGHCLPLGPLREPAVRLDTVDVVVDRADLGGQGLSMVPSRFCHSVTGEVVDVADMLERHASIALVSGIAVPERVKSDLSTLGFSVNLRAFPDHHRFEERDFDGLKEPIIVTEKDAVKLPQIAIDYWIYRAELTLPEGLVDQMLTSLRIKT